ncbi:beta-1,6-N-acetylglucosaminyltransferase [Chitinophaga sp. 22321]|uniref:Peptide O-xylosyltransferase n=1 Tax=Chitinophaga hostae TaxID=2831022 RepID=A0ABS5IZ66_9BACT|nr:beta-1,6-N-acetylglucosaminyltransferase [Chitinophaga hostae]MBS0028138.1 hypothetical protein [Chitinophaga hostae]
MTLNYLILFHKNFGQLILLIDQLSFEHARFFVHIDMKYELLPDELRQLENTPSVTILEDRVNIKWGGFSMITATLSLIKSVMAIKGDGEDYLILLSAQDFPLKNNLTIYQHFLQHRNKVFIDHFTIPYNGWAMDGGLDRLHFYWFMDEVGQEEAFRLYMAQKAVGMVRKQLDLNYYGGSQWWSLNRACAHYILDYCEMNPSFIDFFRHVFVADETLFQTLLQNSPYREHIVNDNLLLMDWASGPEYPKTFSIADIDELLNSPKLFARKFDITKDRAVLYSLAHQEHHVAD